MSINLALLLAASFLPFPTKLMAESLRLTDAEQSAVIFYGASLLVISLLLNAMWRLVAARPHLLRADVDDREIQRILHATTPNLGFYVIAMLLAIVAPQVAAFGYLVLAALCLWLLASRAPGRRRAGSATRPVAMPSRSTQRRCRSRRAGLASGWCRAWPGPGRGSATGSRARAASPGG